VRLTALLAARANQQTVESFPWEVLIPALIPAILALAAYAVGVIRPVAIVQAEYANVGSASDGVTRLYCTIKNRRLKGDRTLTNLALIAIPPMSYRSLHWWWRRTYEDRHPYLLWGEQLSRIVQEGVSIKTRDQMRFECEIRKPGGQPLPSGMRLPESVCLFAYFGRSRAAVKRLAFEP
jgi:hypothetical protein